MLAAVAYALLLCKSLALQDCPSFMDIRPVKNFNSDVSHYCETHHQASFLISLKVLYLKLVFQPVDNCSSVRDNVTWHILPPCLVVFELKYAFKIK